MEAEGHGLGIQGTAVVEAHPVPQGDGHPQAIGAHLGWRRSKAGNQLPGIAQGIEGIPQRPNELQGAGLIGLGGIQGADGALGAHHQVIRGAGWGTGHCAHPQEAHQNR